MIKQAINFFLLAVVFVACKSSTENSSRVEVLPYYGEATFTPKWYSTIEEIPQGFHRIPEFNLLNQNGKKITEKEVEGQIYVADFFFTSCPGICPKLTSNMSLVQNEFLEDDEILLMSHSVTPNYDSVSVLQKYAMTKGVMTGKWHLLTGDRDHIYELGRNAYFAEESLGQKKGIDDFLHTENFILVDKNRYIRGIYNGLNKSSVNQLIVDIKTLKRSESSLH